MELLTIQEVASLLKVNPITVRRQIAAGRLPAVKIGRHVRVKKEAVESLLSPIRPKLPGQPPATLQEQGGGRKELRPIVPHLLTAAEKRRGLAALENLHRLQDELLKKTGGELVTPPSWELLDEARDQRSRDLS